MARENEKVVGAIHTGTLEAQIVSYCLEMHCSPRLQQCCCHATRHLLHSKRKALVYLLTILATTISILSRLVESHPLYYVHRSWISSVHVLISYKSLLHLFVPLNLRLRSRQSMDLIYQLAVSDLDCLVFLRMFRLFPVLQAHKTFGSIQLWLWSLRKSQQDILNKIVR